MKRLISRRATVGALTSLLVVLFAGTVLSGCRTTGEPVAVRESHVCPKCRTELHKTPIENVKYRKTICPECGMIGPADMDTWAEIRDRKYLNVCDKCRAVVQPCPACAR